MSNNGLLFIDAEHPTEWLPMKQYQRERTLFSLIRQIPFFKNFLLLKVWLAFIMFSYF
jgi:hypothetical protein